MTTHTCIIDLETFSSVDIKSAGAWRYIDSPDFEILLLAYAVDDNPTQVIDLASGETPPEWLINALHDPAYTKHAFNAAFEFAALSKVYGMMQPEQWRCSMVHALYCGYPGSLEGAGTAIGLPQEKQKMTVGKALIRYFCCPVKPTKSNGGRTRNFPHHDPEKWALFKEYNRQDVDAEREIDRRLASFPLPPDVQKQWETDLRINRRGVHVDQEMVDGALEIGAGETAALTARARAISGLDNPNSGQQLLGWLHSKGADLPDLQKATVTDALASGKLPDIETTEMLTIRQDLGKTSNKKYEALETCVCADGRVRGLLQFYGANRTGRWAGRLVQVQNLPRTYIEQLDLARRLVKERKADSLRVCFGSVQDTLSQLIRTTLTAEPGKVLIDADFSAIEARVIAWLAGEEWRLEAFQNGKDIYCESASRIFGVPVEKHGVNGHLRAKGKVAELACIAEGQPVLTNRGLVPIEKVTASDLLWDGESWVQHDGVTFKGERDVITYEGLIATPDHLVWIEGKPEPVRFGFASASGAHLVQSADSGKAIRVGTNHRGREESGSREAQVLAQNSRKTRVYDIRNAGRHNRFTVSGKLVHNCGYGGSVGAMRNMGGSDLDMTDDELQQIVNDWRAASPKIVKLWYDLQDAAISAINGAAKKTHGMTFRRETDLVSGHAYLTIQLPSGRKLFYLEPQIGENRWGGASITYLGVNQETKKWERIETYSGKLAENCLAWDTLVLTDRGAKPISAVTIDDRVWDGIEWVGHEGTINKGIQHTIDIGGVRLTPEHKVMTTEGWKRADETGRLNWAQVQPPDSYPESVERQVGEASLGVLVRLWYGDDIRGARSETWESSFMRMHEGEPDFGEPQNARHEQASGMGRVAFAEAALHGPEPQSVEELWRARDYGMQQMGGELRGVLVGHGADVSAGTGNRQDRQQPRIRAGELSLDDPNGQRQKPTNEHARQDGVRHDDGVGAGRADGHRRNDAIVQDSARMAGCASHNAAERAELVYDLRNCGPRHRFTIIAADGQLRIVSNCTQSVARDCLALAIENVEAAGLPVIFHVHDEVVIETLPFGSEDKMLHRVTELMTRPIAWAPGLPLKAEGWVGQYFKKD